MNKKARIEELARTIGEDVEFLWLTSQLVTLGDEESSAETSLRHIFAAGDAVTGAATLILAAADGKSAPTAIHEHLYG